MSGNIAPFVDPMVAIMQHAQSLAAQGSPDPGQVVPEQVGVEQPGDFGGVPVEETPPAAVVPSPAAAPVPEALPEAAPTAAPAAVDPEEAAIDQEIADMRAGFNFNLEDVVPKDILDQLKRQSRGTMGMGELLGIAGLAATNPAIAAQILSDHEQGKRQASLALAQLSQQVLTSKKEGERQVSMYGRYLRRAHEETKKLNEKEKGKEKLARMADVTKLFTSLRGEGVDLEQAGISAPSMEELEDESKYYGPGGWLDRTSAALGKYQGKQTIDEMLAGARNLPVSVLAQKGIDPSAAIVNMMTSAGFTAEEIAQRMPAVQELSKGAALQVQQMKAEIAKDTQWLEWSRSTVSKNQAAIADINSRIIDRQTLQPDEVMGMGARLMGLENQVMNSLNQAQFRQSFFAQEAALAKDPIVKAGKQDQARIMGETALSFQAQLGDIKQAQANLEVIAKQGMAMTNPVEAFWTSLPDVAESSRLTLLTTAGRIPGANPDQMFEAMSAASDPRSWEQYLRGDPNNPFRQMFWTAMLAEIQLKTHMPADQIFRLLNADIMTPGSAPVDTYVGSDVTLPPTIQQNIGMTQQPSGRVTQPPKKDEGVQLQKGH